MHGPSGVENAKIMRRPGSLCVYDVLKLHITCPQPWRDWLSGLLLPHKHAWLDWLMMLLSPRKHAAADRQTLVGLSHETHPRLLQACPALTLRDKPCTNTSRPYIKPRFLQPGAHSSIARWPLA